MCQVVKYGLFGFGEVKNVVRKINEMNILGIGNPKDFFNIPYDELNIMFVAFDYQDKNALNESINFMSDNSNADNRIVAIALNCDSIPEQDLEDSADLFYVSQKEEKYFEDDILTVYTGVMSLLNAESMINIDFHDFCVVTGGKRQLIIGVGEASGSYRANKASEIAVAKLGVDNLTDALFSISASTNINLLEVDRAIDVLRDHYGSNVNVIFGTTIIPEMESFRVTILSAK